MSNIRGQILTAANGTKRLGAGAHTGLNAKGFTVVEAAILAAVDGHNGKTGTNYAAVDFTDSSNFNLPGTALAVNEQHITKQQDGIDFVITDIEVTSGAIVIF